MRRIAIRHLVVLALALTWAGVIAQKRTVWDGIYTAEQAGRGASAYKKSCAGCHGGDLTGDGNAPSLVGESFAFQWSDTTVADLFKRISRTMPSDNPESLSPETYRDIVAFLFQSNKIPAGKQELVPDPDSLQLIAITAAP